jgi:selenocysteine lyase/cysteine desulfurase
MSSANGLNRRDLFRAGLALAATTLVPIGAEAAVSKTEPKEDLSSWEKIRELFPIDRSYLHFAGMLFASHPRPVQAAIDGFRQRLNENPVITVHAEYDRGEEEARKAAAEYLGCKPEYIALTDSTTMGLGLLYAGIQLKPGQEILSTIHDHIATSRSLEIRARQLGTPFRQIPLFESAATATESEIVKNIEKAITPQTRVLAVTWVHSATGMKLPLRAIADRLKRANRNRNLEDRILFCVDGVHGFGAEKDTPEEMGCDFFSAGCHKWIFGPRGTGLLWAREEVASQVKPSLPYFHEDKFWGAGMTPGGFHSFDHRWALGEAFALHGRIGKKKITGRIHELSTQLKDGLAKLPKVKLYTPRSEKLSAGIVCFDIEGLTQKETVERLLKQHKIIASTTPYKVSYARFSPGLLNTPQEVDRAIAAVRALAG